MTNVSPRWESADAVQGFATSAPNAVLMEWARRLLVPGRRPLLLDLGCGAARNAVPLAELGCRVVGLDLSVPMLAAARERASHARAPLALDFVRAPMAPLPFRDGAFDVVVAHGIWNLARSDAEFRSAVTEAARVARPGAGLFLFTFSRDTLPPQAEPVPGERMTFTQFGGEPQLFLTDAEAVSELAAAGFVQDPPNRVTHYNARSPMGLRRADDVARPPVISETTFRRA